MSRRSVLIADDNAEWHAVIARILQPEYDIVGFVERGDEVVARAVALGPDIVTLDVSMPGISGLNLLPELRAELPEAAILILTTTSSKIYTDEAYRRGADAYVLKQSILNDLLPAIQATKVRNPWRNERKA